MSALLKFSTLLPSKSRNGLTGHLRSESATIFPAKKNPIDITDGTSESSASSPQVLLSCTAMGQCHRLVLMTRIPQSTG
jgi:hypothetical protein